MNHLTKYLSVFLLCVAQNIYSADIYLSLTEKDNELLFFYEGSKFFLDISEYVNTPSVDILKVFEVIPKEDGVYALFQTKGYTKGDCYGRGYCGCGNEENTLWLYLNKSGGIEDVLSILTNTCNEGIVSSVKTFSSTHLVGPKFAIEIFYPSDNSTKKYYFQTHKPEEGLIPYE